MVWFEIFCGRAPRRATPKAVARTGAIALALTVAVELSACQTRPPAPPPAPAAPRREVFVPPPPPSPPASMVPLRMEQPNYYRLRNTPRDAVPARVALLLPFSSPSAEVRAVADALQKAAELALFDSGSRDILL